MLETDLFWTFITILSTVIEWIVLRFLLEEISKLKKSKIQLNMSLLIASIIVLILTIIEFNINIKLFICIMITYFIYTYNYEVDMLKGIFISLLYWLMLIGFDSIGLSIVGFINDTQDMSKLLYNNNNFSRLELIIISKSLLILLIPVLKAAKIEVSIEKKDYIYLGIPIVANIISIIVIFGYIFNVKDINHMENIIMIIVSIVLLFSNISLVSIIGRIIKDNKIRVEHEITKEKMNMQYKYYLNLQEYLQQ